MKPDFVNVSVIVSALVDLEMRADVQVRGMKKGSFFCMWNWPVRCFALTLPRGFTWNVELTQKGFSHSSVITHPLKDLYTVGSFYLELGI